MEKPFPPREEGNETYSSPGRGTVKLFIPPNEEEENERFPPPGRSTFKPFPPREEGNETYSSPRQGRLSWGEHNHSAGDWRRTLVDPGEGHCSA